MKRALLLLGVFCILLSSAAWLYASDSYTALLNTPVSITGPDGVCKKVTNASATGLSEYIPTTSVGEWQSFVAHPPAGVTLASCAATWVTNAHCTGTVLGGPMAIDANTGVATSPSDTVSCLSACNTYSGSCCELDTYTNPMYAFIGGSPTYSYCVLYDGTGTAGGTSVFTSAGGTAAAPVSSQAVVPVNSISTKMCDPLIGPAPQQSDMVNPINLYIYQDAGPGVAGSSYYSAAMLAKCQRACGIAGTTFCAATESPAFGPFPHYCQFTVPGTVGQPSVYNPYVASCR